MTTISFDIADEDMQLIQQHLDANALDLADFARQSMLDAIKGKLAMVGINRQQIEGDIDHTTEWNKLGA